MIMALIAPNSRVRKGRKESGAMKGEYAFEGRRMGMLATGEWCNLVSNMLHHV